MAKDDTFMHLMQAHQSLPAGAKVKPEIQEMILSFLKSELEATTFEDVVEVTEEKEEVFDELS